MNNQKKQEFREGYWQGAQDKLAVKNKPLLPYQSINYQLKNIKNAIGMEILMSISKAKTNTILCDQELSIGKEQIMELYGRIEGTLDKQLSLYEVEYTTLQTQIINFIKDSSNSGNVVEFFDSEIWNLDKIEEFVDYFEVNMYASFHLMKKLDRETEQLNLRVLENFLEKQAKVEASSSYIALARASKVGALLEGYRLKIQLLELNKAKVIKSKVGGSNKQADTEMYDKKLGEFKTDFIRVEKIYKQHQTLWMRSSKRLNSVELYDSIIDTESLKVKQGIVESWKQTFGDSITVPELVEKNADGGNKKKTESASYDDLSAWLVIGHTFVYMLMYYGNAPTAPSYSDALNFPQSLVGVVQAGAPLAALFSNFHFSRLISKSYKGGYAVSYFAMILGNFLYYFCKTINSVPMFIIGRMVLGYSGARVITRNFVGTKVKLKYRSIWSSYLVAFTAASTTIGPGISSLLEYSPETTVLGTEYRKYNALSLVFFILSISYCILFYALFTDMPGSPSNNKESQKKKKKAKQAKEMKNKIEPEAGTIPLEVGSDFSEKSLRSFHYSEIDYVEKPNENHEVADPTFKGLKILKHTHIVRRYYPVYFVLIVFTFTKMIQESIISEFSLTLKTHYNYSSQEIGFIYLAFTPFTLSMSLIPGYLAQVKKIKNRNLMIGYFTCLLVTIIMKINFGYKDPQNKWYFFIVSCAALSFTLSAEVSMTAMFGKITPYYIVNSFWNAGLLSGLGDTGGRTFGNTAISLCNSIDGIEALGFWMYIFYAPVFLILAVIMLVSLSGLKIIWKTKVDTSKFSVNLEEIDDTQRGLVDKKESSPVLPQLPALPGVGSKKLKDKISGGEEEKEEEQL